MAKIVGNDISNHQGQPNFDVLVKNANFLIVKATEGTGYTDIQLKRNQSEARRVGLALGYYAFVHPELGNDPIAEADYFLKAVGELKEGEVLALDYEPPTTTQVQAHVDWCRKWLDHVFEKTGVRPLIYLNQAIISKLNWQSVIDGSYGLWIAAYTYDPNNNDFNAGEFKFAVMQQWTSSQQVPGLLGNIDGNVFFGDISVFKKYGYKPAPTPQPPSTNWEQKYKDEVIAHDKTKQELNNTKISLESQISTLTTRLNKIKEFTANT